MTVDEDHLPDQRLLETWGTAPIAQWARAKVGAPASLLTRFALTNDRSEIRWSEAVMRRCFVCRADFD